MSNNIHVVVVHDPMDPRDHSRHIQEFTPGQSVADIFPLNHAASPLSYALNGKVILTEEERKSTYVAEGDFVIIVPVLAGGDSGKSILRIVAFIAVLIVASEFAPLLGGFMGEAGIFGLSASAWSGIIVAAGSVLVNALLPAPKPSSKQGAESPSYGIDGAKNTSAEGIVVPICYGRFRMAGNIINNYVVNDGKTQYLYMLLNAGEGQVAAITDVQVNGQPINTFQDYEIFGGSRALGSTVANATTGAWSFNCPSIPNGTYSLNATSVDATGAAITVSQIIQIDDTGTMPPGDVVTPAATTLAITSIFPDTGVGGDYLTASHTPVIVGNALPGRGITLSLTDELLGTASQLPSPWFATTISPHSVNQKLTTDYKFVVTNGEVDQLRFDLTAPAGLFRTDTSSSDKGDLKEQIVDIQVEACLTGTNNWKALSSSLVVDHYESAVNWLIANEIGPGGTATGRMVQYVPNGSEVADGNGNYFRYYDSGYPVGENGPYYITELVGQVVDKAVYKDISAWRIEANSQVAYRRSFLSTNLPEGIYDIRYKRLTEESLTPTVVDSIFMSDMNEIVLEKVGYRNTALLGLKMRLSDQLNGIPNVTYLNSGKLIRSWNEGTKTWQTSANNNPAWIVLDILTNKRYGGGASESRIDMPALKRWAKYCVEQNLTFNGVFDTQSNIWDAANTVCRTGHAQLLMMGTKFSVVIEAPAEPVMAFNVANMVKGTFKETWMPMGERANEIEFTFANKDNNYNMEPIRVYDQAALAAGAPQRISQVQMVGVTDLTRAYREARLMLNLNKYIKRTVEFSAPIDAIACSVGDVILVQHDMPAWGAGGMLEASNTTSVLNLDRPVLMEYGRAYQALVHFDTINRINGSINSVVGSFVYLNGFAGNTDVKRIYSQGKDYEILSVVSMGVSLHGVEVADPTGLLAGNEYGLYDTNVMVARNVMNNLPAGSFAEVRQITLAAPLPAAPITYAKWMYGEATKTSKPFRVKAIGGTHEYKRDISAIEYNASIYLVDGAVPTPNYSALDDMQVTPVTMDAVGEQRIRNGSTYESRITVSYHSKQASYQDAEVYLSRNGSTFTSVGRDVGSMTVTGQKGETLVFRVVARDRFGRNGAVSNSPTYTYTVLGKTAPPSDVGLITYTLEAFGVRLSWPVPLTDADLDRYELRIGSSWATGVPLAQLKSNSYLWAVQVTGTQTIWIKAFDTAGNESVNASSVTVVISKPLAPIVTYRLSGPDEVISWTVPISGFAIDRYEIRYGASYDTGAQVVATKALEFARKVDYVGSRNYFVAAIDAAGNVGFAGNVTANITAPGAVSAARAEVIDNNALLYWALPATGSLPVAYYDVRKGTTYAGGTPVGSNGNSTFAAIFEQSAGVYTYWVAAVDSAGNVGPAIGITATISQPPDYVLRVNIDSALAGTSVNMIYEFGHLIGPVNTTETWEGHFESLATRLGIGGSGASSGYVDSGYVDTGYVSAGAAIADTSPQTQVDAGFPIYAEPSVTSGSYTELFDYGTILPSTTVTATLGRTIIDGTVAVSCQLAYKAASGDAWTYATAGNTSVTAAGFRYVMAIWTFTCTSGANLISVNSFNIKLSSKQRSDSGTGTAAVGGTTVNFTYPFVAADTPVVQPNGSTPLIPVVIYVGGPNPTSFIVKLYNLSGTDVGGTFSWTARGY